MQWRSTQSVRDLGAASDASGGHRHFQHGRLSTKMRLAEMTRQ